MSWTDSLQVFGGKGVNTLVHGLKTLDLISVATFITQVSAAQVSKSEPWARPRDITGGYTLSSEISLQSHKRHSTTHRLRSNPRE